MVTSSSVLRRAIVPAVIDLVLVLVFVGLGRGFHAEGPGVGATMATAGPFVVALALGWLVTRAWRSPWQLVRPGLGIWIVTVAASMMLRFIAGFGTAVPFIIVTTVVLGALLLGWRAVARLVVAGTSRAR
ncbi:MAG: DUF3054 domain-containing protein [Terrimesophilobacter sp.]